MAFGLLKGAVALTATVVMTVSAWADDTIRFRLDYSIYGTHAPFYLGIEQGLYKDEGIELTIGEGSGSSNTAKLLAQGTDPIGFLDYGTMVKGIAAGMPLKGIFAVHQKSPMIIISHAENPVKSPKDLEGKILGMSQSESTAQMFPVLAAISDTDPAKVNVISPAVGAKTALFLQKRADAITGVTYFHLPPLEAQGAELEYFLYSDFGINALEGGIAANTEWLAANPDLAKRFISATSKAFEIAKAEPEKAVNALIKQRPDLQQNRDMLIRQLELSMEATATPNTEGMPLGKMAEADVQAMLDQFVQSEQIKEGMTPAEVYSNEFIVE
ncbi:ABC transporter substrate-binding protein [Aureimonas fodinaquatilis]|nr:ABC transporter substrate-binding protein [Aureimonas fodinaquatilis]